MSRFRFSSSGDLIGAHLSTKGGLHTAFERAAIIGADSEGRVKYFETEENFKKYNEAAAKS